MGCALEAAERRLVVSKVGQIKVVLHRPLEGTPKTATIRRTATGKWFVSFSCEWEPTPLPPTGREVGLDVGLRVFAIPSEGEPVANPRFFRAEERTLAKAQRQHQAALDIHKALRAALTAQVHAHHPDLEERTVWRLVSQDVGEQGHGESGSGGARWWRGCMSVAAGGAATLRTSRAVRWSIAMI